MGEWAATHAGPQGAEEELEAARQMRTRMKVVIFAGPTLSAEEGQRALDAVRAAELSAFGMEGVGSIYEAFASGGWSGKKLPGGVAGQGLSARTCRCAGLLAPPPL